MITAHRAAEPQRTVRKQPEPSWRSFYSRFTIHDLLNCDGSDSIGAPSPLARRFGWQSKCQSGCGSIHDEGLPEHPIKSSNYARILLIQRIITKSNLSKAVPGRARSAGHQRDCLVSETRAPAGTSVVVGCPVLTAPPLTVGHLTQFALV